MSVLAKIWLQYLIPRREFAYVQADFTEPEDAKLSIVSTFPFKSKGTMFKPGPDRTSINAQCLTGDWRHWFANQTKLPDAEFFQRVGSIGMPEETSGVPVEPNEYLSKKEACRISFKAGKLLDDMGVRKNATWAKLHVHFDKKFTLILPYRPFMPTWILRHMVSIFTEAIPSCETFEDTEIIISSNPAVDNQRNNPFQSEYCVVDYASNGPSRGRNASLYKEISLSNVAPINTQFSPERGVTSEDNIDVHASILKSRNLWHELEHQFVKATEFLKTIPLQHHLSSFDAHKRALWIECAKFLPRYHTLLEKFEPHVLEFLVLEDQTKILEDDREYLALLPWLEPSLRLSFVARAIVKYFELVFNCIYFLFIQFSFFFVATPSFTQWPTGV